MCFINWFHLYTLGRRLTWLKSFFFFFFSLSGRGTLLLKVLPPAVFVCAFRKASAEPFFGTRSLWVHRDIKEATCSPSFSLSHPISIFFSCISKIYLHIRVCYTEERTLTPSRYHWIEIHAAMFHTNLAFPWGEVCTALCSLYLFWGGKNYFHMWTF